MSANNFFPEFFRFWEVYVHTVVRIPTNRTWCVPINRMYNERVVMLLREAIIKVLHYYYSKETI